MAEPGAFDPTREAFENSTAETENAEKAAAEKTKRLQNDQAQSVNKAIEVVETAKEELSEVKDQLKNVPDEKTRKELNIKKRKFNQDVVDASNPIDISRLINTDTVRITNILQFLKVGLVNITDVTVSEPSFVDSDKIDYGEKKDISLNRARSWLANFAKIKGRNKIPVGFRNAAGISIFDPSFTAENFKTIWKNISSDAAWNESPDFKDLQIEVEKTDPLTSEEQTTAKKRIKNITDYNISTKTFPDSKKVTVFDKVSDLVGNDGNGINLKVFNEIKKAAFALSKENPNYLENPDNILLDYNKSNPLKDTVAWNLMGEDAKITKTNKTARLNKLNEVMKAIDDDPTRKEETKTIIKKHILNLKLQDDFIRKKYKTMSDKSQVAKHIFDIYNKDAGVGKANLIEVLTDFSTLTEGDKLEKLKKNTFGKATLDLIDTEAVRNFKKNFGLDDVKPIRETTRENQTDSESVKNLKKKIIKNYENFVEKITKTIQGLQERLEAFSKLANDVDGKNLKELEKLFEKKFNDWNNENKGRGEKWSDLSTYEKIKIIFKIILVLGTISTLFVIFKLLSDELTGCYQTDPYKKIAGKKIDGLSQKICNQSQEQKTVLNYDEIRWIQQREGSDFHTGSGIGVFCWDEKINVNMSISPYCDGKTRVKKNSDPTDPKITYNIGKNSYTGVVYDYQTFSFRDAFMKIMGEVTMPFNPDTNPFGKFGAWLGIGLALIAVIFIAKDFIPRGSGSSESSENSGSGSKSKSSGSSMPWWATWGLIIIAFILGYYAIRKIYSSFNK